jgi:hypothetical protein
MSESGTGPGARASAVRAGEDGAWDATGGQDQVVLSLSELLRDENGEIVLFNDSGFRRVVLEADVRPVERGEAAPHVTAGGVDVAGYQYIAFENGTTLYYPLGLDLEVVREHG